MRVLGLAVLALVLAACSQQSAWGPTVRPVSVEQLKEIAPEGQLPGTAEPVAYRMELSVDPRRASFSGTVEIDVSLKSAATGIWMHGQDLDVQSVSVRAGNETLPGTWTDVLGSGVAWIGFPKRTRVDGVTVTIAYAARFDENLAGLFRVDEQGNAYALAKSESIQARRFMPGFDEPRFKAPFDMSFVIPQGMLAIANTPEISREAAGAGYERVRFARTRPLSTYLLSVAVGNFDRVVRADIPANAVRDTPIPLTGYARAGKGAELDYVLSITPAFVKIFEEALQQPYPYKKLDIVAAPQWPSGATELAGAITYRESRILTGANAGPGFRRALKEIHAHEIAHMWFGDLVTPPWWDDLWLKEGFATWGEPMALTAFEPEEGHEVQAVIEAISAMGLDSLSSVRAVSEPIDRNADIRNAYDSITYRKGMAIIAMADSYFGPEVFRPALGEYIAAFADDEADSADFFKVIGQVTQEPALTEAFESFVTQKGVPLLSAELQCDTPVAKVKLSQSRYRPVGSAIETGTRWTIPVCLSAGYGDETRRTCAMMRRSQAVVSLERPGCPDWLMPNAGGAGYYRFTQDADGWTALTGALADLPATEALMVIDSAAAAHEAGELPAVRLLGVLDSAAGHTDSRVIGAVLNAYGDLMKRLPDGQSLDAAQARVQALANSVRARLAEDDGAAELIGRIAMFEAIMLENDERRAELLGALDAFFGSEEEADPSALSSDLYLAALTVSIDERGEAAFDAALSARGAIDDPVFEQAVAGAIGSATQPQLSRRVRALILSGELGPRETFTLAQTQMENDATREATWRFLRDNFPAFLENIPGQWRRRTPRLAGAFCNTGRLGELELLFRTHGGLAVGHERALAETQESIELCAALKAESEAELIAAFTE